MGPVHSSFLLVRAGDHVTASPASPLQLSRWTYGLTSRLFQINWLPAAATMASAVNTVQPAASSKQPTLPAAADGTLPGWAGRASAVSPQLHSWQPSPGLCNYMALSLCKCFTQHRRGHQFWQWYCESPQFWQWYCESLPTGALIL